MKSSLPRGFWALRAVSGAFLLLLPKKDLGDGVPISVHSRTYSLERRHRYHSYILVDISVTYDIATQLGTQAYMGSKVN